MGLKAVIERSVLTAVTKVPEGLLGRASRALESADRSMLDPKLRAVLALNDSRKPISAMSVEEARKAYEDIYAVMDVPHEPVYEVRNHSLKVNGGEILLRSYRPFEKGDMPAVMFMHGGGHTIGSVAIYDHLCRALSKRLQALVVSVDYRLAPEHPYPVAAEDCIAAWQWLLANAEELGADPGRVGVMGDSAGGNLSAVVSQQARARGLKMPTAQCLVYPALDLRQQHLSHQVYETGFGLDNALLNWFIDHYLGKERTHVMNVLASPGLAKDLAGQPPAVITTAVDPLRDEAIEYLERLREADVTAVHLDFPELVHGHIGMAGAIPAADAALTDICEAFRQIL